MSKFFDGLVDWWTQQYRKPDAPTFGGAGASGTWVDVALRAAAPEADSIDIDRFVGPINATCVEFGITTSRRIAAFVAQIAHESGGFRYVRELASGEAYEGRSDLGNTEYGDGVRFKGRGLIQLTGRSNYGQASLALCGDDRLVRVPQLVERPDLAARVSGWYWKTRGLNELADAGRFADITRRINGGTTGLADRERRWFAVKAQMGIG